MSYREPDKNIAPGEKPRIRVLQAHMVVVVGAAAEDVNKLLQNFKRNPQRVLKGVGDHITWC